MKKVIIFGGFLLLLVLGLAGCTQSDQFDSVESCEEACEAEELAGGECLWQSEADEDMESLGTCLLRGSRHCKNPRQCQCYCIEPEESVEEVDEVTLLLENLAKATGIEFSEIEEEEIRWVVKAEPKVEDVKIDGKKYEAEEIDEEKFESIETYLLGEGFEVDVYNMAAGTVSSTAGYKKDLVVCQVSSFMEVPEEDDKSEDDEDVETDNDENGDEADETDEDEDMDETEKETMMDVEIICGEGDESLNPEVSTEEGIKKLFANKYGKKMSEITLTIETEEDEHIRGGVEFEPGGQGNGGIFLAAKDGEAWVLVFDGTGAISCEQLGLYDFPKEMMEDCENTQTVETEVDGEFSIELTANPTTGFQWILDFDSELLELVAREYVAPEDESLIGAGGTETFNFKAVAEGETEIQFSYLRPWESKQPAEERLYMIEIAE